MVSSFRIQPTEEKSGRESFLIVSPVQKRCQVELPRGVFEDLGSGLSIDLLQRREEKEAGSGLLST